MAIMTLSPVAGTKPKFQLEAVFQSVDVVPVQVYVAAPKAQLVLVLPGGASTELLRATKSNPPEALEYCTFTSEIL